MRHMPIRCGALAMAASLSLAAPAAADDPAPAEEAAAEADDRGDWDFNLAAYGWATDITGHARVRDVSLDVDPQLWNDILYNVNGGLMAAVEARYRGRWIVNLDAFGSVSSQDSEAGPYRVGFGPRTFERQLRPIDATIPVETRIGTLEVPVRVDPGVLRVDVPRVETQLGPFDIDIESILVQARVAFGYRIVDMPALELLGRDAEGDRRRVSFDVLAGARYWYMHTVVDIESPPIEIPEFEIDSSIGGGSVRTTGRIPADAVALPNVRLRNVEFEGATFGGTDVHRSEGSWWIDPIVGLRTTIDLCDRVALTASGNIGGFGISSASKFSWEALVFLNWHFGEQWSLAVGYRGIGFDRSSSAMAADIVMHGPLIGFIRAF
jgi:hypothetical protein